MGEKIYIEKIYTQDKTYTEKRQKQRGEKGHIKEKTSMVRRHIEKQKIYTYGEKRYTKMIYTCKRDYTRKGLHRESEEEIQEKKITRKEDCTEKKERTYKWKRYTRKIWNKYKEKTIQIGDYTEKGEGYTRRENYIE